MSTVTSAASGTSSVTALGGGTSTVTHGDTGPPAPVVTVTAGTAMALAAAPAPGPAISPAAALAAGHGAALDAVPVIASGLALVTSYAVSDGTFASPADPMLTPSFTPATGELIVIKILSQEFGNTYTLTGGSLTYTKRLSGSPTENQIWTAPVVSSPGSMTVSINPSIGGLNVVLVERWTSAKLAGTPATDTEVGSGSTPSACTITTVANNSVVTWANIDYNANAIGGRTYVTTTATPAEESVGLANGQATYFAYQAATTAGVQHYGLTAPANQTWRTLALELEAA